MKLVEIRHKKRSFITLVTYFPTFVALNFERPAGRSGSVRIKYSLWFRGITQNAC